MPAGTYHLVLDCIVTAKVDVTFELISRQGGQDALLTTWSQHFSPGTAGYEAQAYEVDQTAPAIEMADGAQLVFRYTASNTTGRDAWIPNGDGKLQHGRIPNITLPP